MWPNTQDYYKWNNSGIFEFTQPGPPLGIGNSYFEPISNSECGMSKLGQSGKRERDDVISV